MKNSLKVKQLENMFYYDYFFLNRNDLPPIPSTPVEMGLNKRSERGFSGGKPILIFTLSGVVKFNFSRNRSFLHRAKYSNLSLEMSGIPDF